MKNTNGFKRLMNIKPFTLYLKDLNSDSLDKVKSTTKYALSQNPDQNTKDVLTRCVIAQLAEQYVADWMEGWVNSGSEDTSEPFTYAFDVLSNVKYNGLRIEVKTAQSDSKYISLAKKFGEPGLHIGPMINFNVADVIIIFKVKPNLNGWHYDPIVLADKNALSHPQVTVKSNFNGYYLGIKRHEVENSELNLHYF